MELTKDHGPWKTTIDAAGVVETRRGESEVERSFRGTAETASIIRRIGDAGAAATGSHDPVHGDARAGERIGSDRHASISPTVPGSQRQHGGGAASECVNGGVVRAVLGSNIADGSASARICVRGVAKQFGASKATGR